MATCQSSYALVNVLNEASVLELILLRRKKMLLRCKIMRRRMGFFVESCANHGWRCKSHQRSCEASLTQTKHSRQRNRAPGCEKASCFPVDGSILSSGAKFWQSPLSSRLELDTVHWANFPTKLRVSLQGQKKHKAFGNRGRGRESSKDKRGHTPFRPGRCSLRPGMGGGEQNPAFPAYESIHQGEKWTPGNGPAEENEQKHHKKKQKKMNLNRVS